MFTKVGPQKMHGGVKRKELWECKGKWQNLPKDLVWMLTGLDVADCVTGSYDNLVPGTAED